MNTARARCGLIGLGHHGRRYADVLTTEDVGGELVAVCRRDIAEVRKFAEPRGIAWHADYRTLIGDPTVEVVLVVVPPGLHAEICLEALRAGKPILVEKPLALSLHDARLIASEAARTGTPLMVAQTLRFDPVIRALRAALPSAGKLSTITITQRFAPAAAEWVGASAATDTIAITGVHGFDLACYLNAGEVTAVSCHAVARRTRAFDSFIAVLWLAGDAPIISIENTRASGGRYERLEAVGRDAILIADLTAGELTEVRGKERSKHRILDRTPALQSCLREFLYAVTNHAEMPVALADGVSAVAIADACRRSATTRTTVSLEVA